MVTEGKVFKKVAESELQTMTLVWKNKEIGEELENSDEETSNGIEVTRSFNAVKSQDGLWDSGEEEG